MILPFLSSCTHNRGDIGALFGFWWLNDLTVNGVTPENFDPELTSFAFMADNVEVMRQGESHGNTVVVMGTWSMSNGMMSLNFSHHNNQGPIGYPAWIYMTEPRIYEMKIITYTSKKLILEWINDDGDKIVYNLGKVL